MVYVLLNIFLFIVILSWYYVKWEVFRDGCVNWDNDCFVIEVLDGEFVVKFDVDFFEGFWWFKWVYWCDSDYVIKDVVGDVNILCG